MLKEALITCAADSSSRACPGILAQVEIPAVSRHGGVTMPKEALVNARRTGHEAQRITDLSPVERFETLATRIDTPQPMAQA